MVKIITPTSEIEQPLEGVIFDMDGVTLNSMDHAYDWQKHVYGLFGDKTKVFGEKTPEWLETYNDLYESGSLQGIYENLAHVDWECDGDDIWEIYGPYNKEHLVEIIEQDGTSMDKVIQNVHERGHATGIRTNRLRLAVNTSGGYVSKVEPVFGRYNLTGCFDSIVTFDNVLRMGLDGIVKKEKVFAENLRELRKLLPKGAEEMIAKPNSLCAMLAVNSLGVSQRATIAFEDTRTGVKTYKPVMGPRMKPVYTVGVTWGFQKDAQKLIDAGADAIMESPTEIEPFIEQLGAFS